MSDTPKSYQLHGRWSSSMDKQEAEIVRLRAACKREADNGDRLAAVLTPAMVVALPAIHDTLIAHVAVVAAREYSP